MTTPRRKPARACLTEPQRREIARRFSEGERAKTIAAEYGCSPTYPNKLARMRGLPNRHGLVDIVIRVRGEVIDALQDTAREQHTSLQAIGAEAIAAYVGVSA